MKKLKKWLKKIDCEGELELVTSDASYRKYYRLKSSMHSGMVMDASNDKEGLIPFIELEHRLFEAGVRTPKIFTYSKKKGFLFLEDLGDTHLSDVIDNDFELFYGKALDCIMKMQTVDIEDLPMYDNEFLRSEMELMPEWYLEKYLGLLLDDAQKNRINSIFEVIIKEVSTQPQDVFVHRDFHSRNLMFGCSEDIVVIDYQDARVGAVTYDLVSLLRDVYVELHPSDVERLALSFRDKKGLDVDDETFMRWFDFMGLQRHIKILGIFSRLHIRDGKDGYLKDIPLALKYIKEVSSKYPEIDGLSDLLH